MGDGILILSICYAMSVRPSVIFVSRTREKALASVLQSGIAVTFGE